MAPPRRIDVHFHLIPPFYREAVYTAGRGPAIGRYPEWTPQLALELMDAHGIKVALTSLAQPGVGFASAAGAQELARRCNDYAAELIARWPKRFGAFGTVPMGSIESALDAIAYSLDTLKFAGVSLFASYGENFLGDARFDPLLAALDERGAVVFVHPGLHPSSSSLALPWPAYARGGEPHLLPRDRALPAHSLHPAARRRAGALFRLAACGLADDRSAPAAAVPR
jgi:6-methylsalicylate decarboxylase